MNKPEEFIKLVNNNTRDSRHGVFSCFFNRTEAVTKSFFRFHNCTSSKVINNFKNCWSVLVDFRWNHYAFVIFSLNSFAGFFIGNDIINLKTKAFNCFTKIIYDIVVICDETRSAIWHPEIVKII